MTNPQPEFVASFPCVACTDVGMRRANNQDSHDFVYAESEQSWRERGHLFIVADGMGAHAAGELASKLAVENIRHLYYHERTRTATEALRSAITEANREIHRRGMANPEFRGMGTTASALVLLPEAAFVGHVGDSRVYRFREGRLEQLTFDHSLQWEVRRNSRISENSDFARMIPKNVITRSLGPNEQVTVDIEGPFSLQQGDQFLICSDGLTGQIPDDELAGLLQCLSPEEAAQSLIDLANLRGGPDNITLIIVQVVDDRVLTDAPDAKPVRRPLPASRSPLPLSVVGPVAGVCLLVSVLLWLAQAMLPAAFFGAVGMLVVIATAVGWLRQRMPAQESEPPDSTAMGEAPYVTCTCGENGGLAGVLSRTLGELRQAARDENWTILWQDIDALRDAADKAAEAGQFPEAVRQNAKAIRQIMQQLRKQTRENQTGFPIP
jgi:PPM family protein phosphatase